MNIKYKCVCSHKGFIRGNDYEVNKHDLISPYDKSSAGSVYLYGNTDIVFLKTIPSAGIGMFIYETSKKYINIK